MKIGAEAMAIILTCFCFTLSAGYLWGYARSTTDNPCRVTKSE